jgi:hypothetical protein
MSHGVRLVRRPRRATTIHLAQMLAAVRPYSAPRVYSAEVGFHMDQIGFRRCGLVPQPPHPMDRLAAAQLLVLSNYLGPPKLSRPPDF